MDVSFKFSSIFALILYFLLSVNAFYHNPKIEEAQAELGRIKNTDLNIPVLQALS